MKKTRNPNKIRFMPFEATWGPQRNSPDEQSLYSCLRELILRASLYQLDIRTHSEPFLFSAEHPTTQKANTRTSCFRCLCVDMCVCDHIWTPERPHRHLKKISLIACRIHLQCTRPYVLSKGSKSHKGPS